MVTILHFTREPDGGAGHNEYLVFLGTADEVGDDAREPDRGFKLDGIDEIEYLPYSFPCDKKLLVGDMI